MRIANEHIGRIELADSVLHSLPGLPVGIDLRLCRTRRNADAGNMVAVLVRYQNGIDIADRFVRKRKSLRKLFTAQTAVD